MGFKVDLELILAAGDNHRISIHAPKQPMCAARGQSSSARHRDDRIQISTDD